MFGQVSYSLSVFQFDHSATLLLGLVYCPEAGFNIRVFTVQQVIIIDNELFKTNTCVVLK